MIKTSIFFSHSSKDARALAKLKELFIAKTGGSLQVFLSSDGQSVPFGRNWVASIEQALNDSALVFSFITPNSLRSSWLYFESGFACARGASVVPVGMLGVDLQDLSPPLSLLQGFNINSHEGLNNIIVIANSNSGHSHAAQFTPDDYIAICGNDLSSQAAFAGLLGVVELIQIRTKVKETEAAIRSFKSSADAIDLDCTLEHGNLLLHGMRISRTPEKPNFAGLIDIELDPRCADSMFGYIVRAFGELHADPPVDHVQLKLRLVSGICAIQSSHSIAGRLRGHSVKLLDMNRVQVDDFVVSVGVGGPEATTFWLMIGCKRADLSASAVAELMTTLVENEIVFAEN